VLFIHQGGFKFQTNVVVFLLSDADLQRSAISQQ
jgi:hypothetical protein